MVSLGGRLIWGCKGVAEYGGERSFRTEEGVRPEAGNVDGTPLVVKSYVVGQVRFSDPELNVGPDTKSPLELEDGEWLFISADGDDSWLVTIADRGEASREPRTKTSEA